MPISSLIIQSKESRSQEVADRLRGLAGVEVSEIRGDQVVVLTETSSRKEDREVWKAMESTEHVLGVSLIYHNFEDLEETAS